jgi:hypothetical protein
LSNRRPLETIRGAFKSGQRAENDRVHHCVILITQFRNPYAPDLLAAYGLWGSRMRQSDTPYEVAPPTPGTNVTKDPVHSWVGTPQRTKPNNEPNTGTPSGDDKISGNHADHIPPPTFWSESDAEG